MKFKKYIFRKFPLTGRCIHSAMLTVINATYDRDQTASLQLRRNTEQSTQTLLSRTKRYNGTAISWNFARHKPLNE